MASGGVPEIKKLWQHGEELSLDGKHSEAILHFQRAKSMLLVESKALYGATEIPQDGGGGSKLMGDILTKLSESINRDVKLINANAVHALGLKRGFTKADVKKAYRTAALKYHPDKNKDCDTSCIFAAIQSGYEKLNATLDAGEVPSVSGDPQPKRSANRDNTSGGPNYFYTSHKDVGRRNGQKDRKPSPYTFDQTRQVPKASAPRGGVGPKHDKDVSGNSPRVSPRGNRGATPSENLQREKAASNLSDDHLRILLKQFGFNDRQVRGMSRQELIGKYLAVSAHIGGGPSVSENSSDGSSHSARRKARGCFDAADGGGGSGGNSGNHGPRDREREFLKAQREASKGRRGSKFCQEGVAPGTFLDDDDDGAFHVPPDFVPPPVGGKYGRTGGGGYPTAASARGGLDGFEAMAKAWADEWQKEMKKEIHKEQMQYQRQLEKEIGVKPPISRQDKRKRNNAGTAGNSDKGVEYTHIPEELNRRKQAARDKTDQERLPRKSNFGNNGGPGENNYKSPFASTHYTQKLERAKKEEKIAAETLARNKDKAGKRRARSNTTDIPTSSTSDVHEGNNNSQESDRARVADALRVERAAWMEERLPMMSREELQNISTASGVSWHGNDSDDKLRKELARYYGIRLPNRETGGVSAAQAALRSKLHDSTDRRRLPNSELHGMNNTSSKPNSQQGRRDKNDISSSSVTGGGSSSTNTSSQGHSATFHGAHRVDGTGNTESGSLGNSDAQSKYISTQQIKELERRMLGPQGRDRQKFHKGTNSASSPNGDGSSDGKIPQPGRASVAAEPSPPLAPGRDDELQDPPVREHMRDLSSVLSVAAKRAAFDEVEATDKQREEEEMAKRGKAFLKKYMDEPRGSSRTSSSGSGRASSSSRLAASAKVLQAAQNARRNDQGERVYASSPRTEYHPNQDKGKAQENGKRKAKLLPPLTIEIDEIDPIEVLGDEEPPQVADTKKMMYSNATNAIISEANANDKEDETDFGENEENLLARLQQKGWDIPSLTSTSALISEIAEPVGAVKAAGADNVTMRTRTNSRESIRRRAALQEKEKEKLKEKERKSEIEIGTIAPSTPPANISGSNTDTGGGSAGTAVSAASAETDEDMAEGMPSSRVDDGGVEDEVDIKFGIGMLDDEDDGDNEEEEESSLELDKVPKGPRVFEAVLRQQEMDDRRSANNSTAPVVAPGRIRKMASYASASSGASGVSGNDSANPPHSSGQAGLGSPRGKVDLRLDLSGISKLSGTEEISEERKRDGEQDLQDVQEEVDFWVNSARSDMSSGNTYQDLEFRLNAELAQQAVARDTKSNDKEGNNGNSHDDNKVSPKPLTLEGQGSTPRTIGEAVAMAGGGRDSIAQVSRRLLNKYSARDTASPRDREPPEINISADTRPDKAPMSPEEVNKEMAELRRRIAEDKNQEYLASYETTEEKEIRERTKNIDVESKSTSTVPAHDTSHTGKKGDFLFFG